MSAVHFLGRVECEPLLTTRQGSYQSIQSFAEVGDLLGDARRDGHVVTLQLEDGQAVY